MPPGWKHRKQTLSTYGIDGASIHKWMDEPWKIYGPSHRKVRHRKNQELPKALIEEYGKEMAHNIMLDHVLLDLNEKNDDENGNDMKQLEETTLVLRAKVGELETNIQNDRSKFYRLEREIKKLKDDAKNERRKWKMEFIERYCGVYSKMVEQAIKHLYMHNRILKFRYHKSFYEDEIKNIDLFYKQLYIFDEPDARKAPWHVIEHLGQKMMSDIFETIRDGVKAEVAVFKQQILDNPFDNDLS